MTRSTANRRRLDRKPRYRSNNYRFRFIQDLEDYPDAHNMLCEGDSWFGYPKFDLLDHIATMGEANMLRMEKSGDELMQNMLRSGQRRRFEHALSQWSFDTVLYSAGGNDIIGEDGRTLTTLLTSSGTPDNPRSYIN